MSNNGVMLHRDGRFLESRKPEVILMEESWTLSLLMSPEDFEAANFLEGMLVVSVGLQIEEICI